MNKENRKIFYKILREIKENTRFLETRAYIQHGRVSVYEHCIRVAIESIHIAEKLGVIVDYPSMIKGALLHDYFLYDWHHNEDKSHFFHGFTHPYRAYQNALEDISLSHIEKDIIIHHMFPLLPLPPRTKEGMIVCLADKKSALWETLFRRKSSKGIYSKRKERVS